MVRLEANDRPFRKPSITFQVDDSDLPYFPWKFIPDFSPVTGAHKLIEASYPRSPSGHPLARPLCPETRLARPAPNCLARSRSSATTPIPYPRRVLLVRFLKTPGDVVDSALPFNSSWRSPASRPRQIDKSLEQVGVRGSSYVVGNVCFRPKQCPRWLLLPCVCFILILANLGNTNEYLYRVLFLDFSQ